MKMARVKTRDKWPDRGFVTTLAMREDRTEPGWPGSIGSRGMPQCQHAIETEAIDRLRDTGLLDLPRNPAQPERVQGNGRRGSQKGQVAEARRQFEIVHRQVALDVFLCDQPCDSGFLVAELIDQLQIDRLTTGEDTSVGDFVQQ